MMTTRRMAALLATAISIVPMHAYAQDSGRILSDPNYLPLSGEFDGTTSYTYGMTKGDVFDSTGAKLNTFRIHTNTITQGFDYGVTDDFTVGLSMAYNPLVHRTIDPVGGPSRSTDRSGFSDPSIDATYRLMDESRGPMIVDLFAAYFPDLFRAQVASNNDDGTVARGGQAATLGLALGREWPGFGIRGTASANWVGDRNLHDPATASTLNESSVWNYNAGISAQARFTDRTSLNFGAGYVFRHNYGVTDATTAEDFTVQPGNMSNVHVALNYHFVPNRVVGSLSYQYNHYNPSRDINTAPPALISQTRNQNENVFGARLAYVLN